MFRSLLSIVALGAAITALAAPVAARSDAAHCPPTATRACASHHHFVAVPGPVQTLVRPLSQASG